MDNMGDGRNCIAMDRPNPDIPGAASQQMKLGPSVRGLEMRELDLDTDIAGVFRKVESDVLLNSDEEWADICGLRNPIGGTPFMETVAAHELGHTAGLQHTDCFDEVMYRSAPRSNPGTLDRIRMQILYPSWNSSNVFPDNRWVED